MSDLRGTRGKLFVLCPDQALISSGLRSSRAAIKAAGTGEVCHK